MASSVADVMVAMLKASGVRRVYGIPGDSLNGFTDAMRRAGGIAWQHVRHEEAAAFAAAADAALTGELAVCAASCGPGNLHLINGLFDANRSRVPVLAIAAHIPGMRSARSISGPFMATEDSINVTVYGKGGHGAMPQHTIDPVVLAAMIIVRLQTIVSRETPPGEIAVVTVGSVHAGTRSNLIPDHALLQLNLRSYSQQTRERMLASIQRIVRAEGQASGSPQDPDFETVGSFPLTVNDPATTDRVAAAFATHFGDHALEIDRQTVSEDFSNIPNAAGVPYTYWAMGFTDEKTYRAAEKAGRLQDLPTNHSPKFLPPLQPTLRTGTEALVTAALAWLEPR